jgi:ketosteroid isomerase-like protein
MNVTSATSSLRTTRPSSMDLPSTSTSTTTSASSSSSTRVDNFVGVPVSEGERNRKVVDDFYKAFERKDGAAMTAAYAPNAKFSDPVFPKLENGKGAAMWRMLCKSDELKVRHEILKVDGDTVTARWVANYKFLGNDIENHVTSTIKLKDGKIVDHKDSFDMSKWLGQAYGMAAKLPFAEHVLGGITRHVAGNRLDNFIANER